MHADPAVTVPPIEAFRFALPASLAKPDSNGRRKFSGVAYSGDMISSHWYWGNLVFDIASTKAPEKVPALVEHQPNRIAGSGTMSFGSEMRIEGLLSAKTPDAQLVADQSDEGFPWQMSVYIEPGSIEEVKPGSNITVNGRQFTGPVTVFRNSMIREVSFCATGADANTSAQVFSRHAQREEPTMTQETNKPANAPSVEDLQAQVTKLTADVAAANARAESAEKEAVTFRRSRLAEMFKARSEPHEGEDFEKKAKPFLAMSSDAFEAAMSIAGAKASTATTQRQERDPKLFKADDVDTGTRPTGAKSSLVENARARSAATQGKTH